MPTFKQLIISGSNVSELNNDAGYVTSSSGSSSFLPLSGGTLSGDITGASGLTINWLNSNTRITGSNSSGFLQFDVGGTSEVLKLTSTSATFSGRIDGNVAGFYLKEGSSSAFSMKSNGANGYLLFRDEYNSADRLKIEQSGQITIGGHISGGSTATFGGKITSSGGTATYELLLLKAGSGNHYPYMRITRDNGSYHWDMGMSSDGLSALFFKNASGSNALKLDTDLSATFGGNVGLPTGSVSAPSLYWGTDTNTGIYHSNDNNIRMTINGTKAFELDASRNLAIDGGATFGGDVTLTNSAFTLGTASDVARLYYSGGGGQEYSFKFLDTNNTYSNIHAHDLNIDGGLKATGDLELYTDGVRGILMYDSGGDAITCFDNNLRPVTANTGEVGTSADSFAKAHINQVNIQPASSGATAHTEADNLIIEDSASTGMSILFPSSSKGSIMFGHQANNSAFSIVADSNNNRMSFSANQTYDKMKFNVAGSQNLELSGASGVEQAVFTGKVGIGTNSFYSNDYSHLSIKGDSTSGVSGIAFQVSSTVTSARNWSITTNSSAHGSLDFRYSSAYDSTPNTNLALSINSSGNATFSGNIAMSGSTSTLHATTSNATMQMGANSGVDAETEIFGSKSIKLKTFNSSSAWVNAISINREGAVTFATSPTFTDIQSKYSSQYPTTATLSTANTVGTLNLAEGNGASCELKFQINGITNTSLIPNVIYHHATNTTTAYNHVYKMSDGTLMGQIEFNPTGTSQIVTRVNQPLAFGVNNSHKMTIGTDGNVTFGVGGSFADKVYFNGRVRINKDGQVHWGSAYNQGYLSWDTNEAIIGSLASHSLKIQSGGATAMVFDTSQNATFSGNVDISRGASDDAYLKFTSSDSGHGITDIIGTTTFGFFDKVAYGHGLRLTGFSNNTGVSPLNIRAVADNGVSNSIPAMEFQSLRSNGSTGTASIVDAGISFRFKNDSTSLLDLYGNGNATFSGNVTVQHATNPILNVIDSTNNTRWATYVTDSKVFMGSITNHSLAIVQNDTERVIIGTDGKTTFSGQAHIKLSTAGSSVVANTENDDLVIETNGNTGMTMLSPDANDVGLGWGSASLNRAVLGKWNYNANSFRLRTNKANAIMVFGGGESLNTLTLDGSNNATFSGSITGYSSSSRYLTYLPSSGLADFEIVTNNNSQPVFAVKGTGTADLFKVYDDTTVVFNIADGGNATFGGGVAINGATLSGSLKLFVDNGESKFNRGNSTGTIAEFRGSNAEQMYIGTDTFRVKPDARFSGTVLIDGLSNYTGLEVKGAGGSRPHIKWENVNNGRMGSIFGTEGNALVFTSGTGGATALTLDSSQNATFSGAVHIMTSDASLSSADANASLIVEENDHTYIELLTPNNKQSGIIFSDGTIAGLINYNHSTNAMTFGTNDGAIDVTIDSSGNTTFGGSVYVNSSLLEVDGANASFHLKNSSDNYYRHYINDTDHNLYSYYNSTLIRAYSPTVGWDIRGDVTYSGQIKASNGTASAPAYAFGSQASTGMYKGGTSLLYFSVNGTRKVRVESTQIVLEDEVYCSDTLGVTGNITMTPPTSGGSTFEIRTNDGEESKFIFADNTGGDYWIFNHDRDSAGTSDDSLSISSKNTSDVLKLLQNGKAYFASNVYSNAVLLTSDKKFKDDVKDIPNALETTSKLRGVSYIDNRDKTSKLGVIAQEVEPIIPEVVSTESHTKYVDYIQLVPMLIESIKELKEKVEDLESKLNQ